MTAIEQRAIGVLDQWYDSLDRYQDQLPSKGSIGAALHVLNRLRENFDLSIDSHVSGKESQIAGLSAAAQKKVLAEFGETRSLSSVGGRSNRGARGDVGALLDAMRTLKLECLSPDIRNAILVSMQRHIVENYVPLFHSAKRVKATFDLTETTSQFLHTILDNAKQNGKGGAVAEHLVGAKLTLKFPHIPIRNKPSSSADTNAGFAGDFKIGNTIFHVTLAPMPELFEKIKGNLADGLRVYLLVGQDQLAGATQQADLQAKGRITVESIESFVATNVDELSGFDGDRLARGINLLLSRYNERVDEVELDKTLLIEIPPNLE